MSSRLNCCNFSFTFLFLVFHIHSFIYLLNRIKIDWDMLLLSPLVCRRGEMGEARNCCYIRRESPYRLSLRLLCFHQNFLIPLSLELSWSTPNIQNHWCLETSKENFVRVWVCVLEKNMFTGNGYKYIACCWQHFSML